MSKLVKKLRSKKKPAPPPLRLNLGCGTSKLEGYVNIDISPRAKPDLVLNLFHFPWPYDDDSVDEIVSSHFLEHVPRLTRPKLMDEMWRVMKVDAAAVHQFPYWSSMRAIQDFTHVWPPLCEASFQYFNQEWRKANGLLHGHYRMQCNFDFSWEYIIGPPFTGRSQEFVQSVMGNWVNVVQDMKVKLVKKARVEE